MNTCNPISCLYSRSGQILDILIIHMLQLWAFALEGTWFQFLFSANLCWIIKNNLNPPFNFYCSEKLLWNWFDIDSVCWLRLSCKVSDSRWVTLAARDWKRLWIRRVPGRGQNIVLCVSGRAFSVLHHVMFPVNWSSHLKAERSSGVKCPGLKVTCLQKLDLTSVKHNFPPYHILFTLFFSSCVSEAEKESHGKCSTWP